MSSPGTRLRLTVEGIVQGVGFRPFLHRLAEQYGVCGWVRNTSRGIEGILTGSSSSLEKFLAALSSSPPPMARVDRVAAVPEDGDTEYRTFSIRESRISPGSTLVSPDISVCPECAGELYDPSDRRYRYPFINCTNCGPRYTIIRSLPYDRARTVMDEFAMCGECREEYADISDRRYHAQPDCCPACGPRAFYVSGAARREAEEDPFRAAQALLLGGGILAVKGLGGIHLACNAMDQEAVNRLRMRKRRAEKPLALMCRSLEAVRRICRVTDGEEKVLTSPARPIVLLAKKDRDALPWLSFSPRLGVMLPYTPLHMLLLDGAYGGPEVLVMTSGNLPGCPVITDNEEALSCLEKTADGFLLHDRDIQNRCDDSLVMELGGNPYFFRRSRGYAPMPIDMKWDADGIFAMGAEQKASFALGRGSQVFVSPHIGDLKNGETFEHYGRALRVYQDLFRLKPALYVCDLHPDYISTRTAAEASAASGLPLLQVQHHWAHMASCMADNRLDGPCFGIIWDGTGMGTDGTVWGGEFLKGGYESFTRTGSIRPVSLPGGDRAVYEIGRIALALACDAGVEDTAAVPLPAEKRRMLSALLGSGFAPKASSIGRLFDGMCAFLLHRSDIDYEGEGASLVEALSPYETPDLAGVPLSALSYPLQFYLNGPEQMRVFDTRPLVRSVLEDLEQGTDKGHIALRFLATLCCMALDQCIALNPGKLPVVLSGGVFQNRFLLAGITSLLTENGFEVFTHRQVSASDEGLCLGQIAIAQKKRRMDHVFSNADED